VKRRTFIAGLGSAAAWPVVARAQQSALPVIGFLYWDTRLPEAGPVLTGFRQGLAAIGYSENRNVAIDFRWANGDALLPAHVTDLVQRRDPLWWGLHARVSSLRLEPELLDKGPPFIGIGLLQSAERVWGLFLARENFHPEIGKPRSYRWIGQRLNGRPIELTNDVP
jgi:hypothetical protein